MTKRKPKKTIKKLHKKTPRLQNSQERHLNTLILYTKNNITNKNDSLDDLFKHQLVRLQKELKTLRSCK